MKIAVSAETNQGLNSAVAHHFGRCPYFALVEVDDHNIKDVEVIQNPYYESHRPGQVPAFINKQNAKVMISGGMGRRAIRFFEQYNIQTASGATGTVKSVLESYLSGELRGAAPCKESIEHG